MIYMDFGEALKYCKAGKNRGKADSDGALLLDRYCVC